MVNLELFFIFIFSVSFFLQFLSSVLLLGAGMLLICVSIFFLLSFLNLFWYSLIFLLINVGGSMVLFYYMFLLQSNPVGSVSFLSFFFVALLFFFFFFLSFFSGLGISETVIFSSSVEDVSFFLFNFIESNFLIFLSGFLVFVLLVVSMLTSTVGGSFRFFRI
uniref:NADH dehydrogenase subunit 6 n=1 Tax=Bipalium adventitium TaxID=66751 RepID=A0A8K1XU50_9PLAT|nr:NADH dehydrogenase subunit 6 [Bipalium adventitium]